VAAKQPTGPEAGVAVVPRDGAPPRTEPARTAAPPPARSRLLSLRLSLIGLCGGVLSGLLGVGGGAIMVPLLVLWGRYGQRAAHAASLGAIIPISAAGVIAFGAAGEVQPKEAVALALGAIVGARIGAGILARADERALKIGFGAFLLLVAALMAVGR
jgi:uncharacterized membrane protein YfcA